MFNQRKNKTFNYQSRFGKKSETENFSETSEKPDFISKWKGENYSTRKVKGVMSLKTLLLILVLLLICMYILDSKFN